ncbi:hypothetical protein BJX63DRAFT_393305 [Aspergillus granulosus]|uniref:Extracellular membrane protein CFEM domain-containing protein n=1 Tax=Aspergillus granulosus TaxID=176169 RepID=A0ABR4HEV5_9EURO
MKTFNISAALCAILFSLHVQCESVACRPPISTRSCVEDCACKCLGARLVCPGSGITCPVDSFNICLTYCECVASRYDPPTQLLQIQSLQTNPTSL